jgi:hypothetical protein
MPTTTQADAPPNKPTYSSQYSHSYPPLPVQANTGQISSSSFAQTVTHDDRRPSSLAPKYHDVPARTISADSPYFLGMNSPYPESSSGARAQPYNQNLASAKMDSQPPAYHYAASSAEQHAGGGMVSQGEMHPSMMIECHDVDMNSLHQQDSFPFSNGEILPWLEYLPQDVLSFFGEHQNYPLMSPDDTTPRPPH